MKCVISDPQGAQECPKYLIPKQTFSYSVCLHISTSWACNHLSVNYVKPSSDIVLLKVLQHDRGFNTLLLRTKYLLMKLFEKEK